jgi:hypothetical protein
MMIPGVFIMFFGLTNIRVRTCVSTHGGAWIFLSSFFLACMIGSIAFPVGRQLTSAACRGWKDYQSGKKGKGNGIKQF